MLVHIAEFPPLIAIVGPTAVGKSAFALTLSEAIGGEIVTADSRQVYRFMDIGTDKPGSDDQLRVPHHMIDLVHPDEAFTLAMYQDKARQVLQDIWAKGKVPVLAGGTPLYALCIIEGWVIPRVEPDLQLRKQLETEADEYGPVLLHERLAHLDPESAEGILPSNTRRIIRALEVITLTGQPMSVQQRKQPPAYNILTIGLKCERSELYGRIDARVEQQFEIGLVEEVHSLNRRGYAYSLPSMSGLGYRQVGEYLMGKATLEETKKRIKWDTHAFVRHQMNWFKRIGDARWIDVTNSDPSNEATRIAAQFLTP